MNPEKDLLEADKLEKDCVQAEEQQEKTNEYAVKYQYFGYQHHSPGCMVVRASSAEEAVKKVWGMFQVDGGRSLSILGITKV